MTKEQMENRLEALFEKLPPELLIETVVLMVELQKHAIEGYLAALRGTVGQ